MSCRRDLMGASHPFSARVSAKPIALFRFRREFGPRQQISRTLMVGSDQWLMSQSSNFSVGDDCGVVGGTIGFSNGPLGIVSSSTGRSFGSVIYRAKKLGLLPSPLVVDIRLSLEFVRVVFD